MANANQQEPSSGSNSTLILMPIWAIIAAWSMYTCWVVAGGLVGAAIDGGIRFFATFVIAVGFPMLTALSFTNTREEGSKGLEIVNRVLIGASLVCAGTAFVIGVAVAGKCVPVMFEDPNWFVSQPHKQDGFPDINRRYTRMTANFLCKTAHQVGTHYCP